MSLLLLPTVCLAEKQETISACLWDAVRKLECVETTEVNKCASFHAATNEHCEFKLMILGAATLMMRPARNSLAHQASQKAFHMLGCPIKWVDLVECSKIHRRAVHSPGKTFIKSALFLITFC